MQKSVLKLLLFTLLAVTTSSFSQIDIDKSMLEKADSLFIQKKYTESLSIYENLFAAGKYSTGSLLKLAYIHEGMGRMGPSIFFLHHYYRQTSDLQALDKIQELARKNKLTGYERSDWDLAKAFLSKYYLNVSLGLIALTLFAFSLIIYLRKKNNPGLIAFSAVVAFSILLLVHVNTSGNSAFGITSSTSTLLMSGPSAGSTVIEVIGEGHRLKITGSEDVWLRAQWFNRQVFVKKDKLLQLKY